MKLTDEERVAVKLVDLLSDLRLDLDLLGYYFANLASITLMGRLEEVVGSANETADTVSDRMEHYQHIVSEDKD